MNRGSTWLSAATGSKGSGLRAATRAIPRWGWPWASPASCRSSAGWAFRRRSRATTSTSTRPISSPWRTAGWCFTSRLEHGRTRTNTDEHGWKNEGRKPPSEQPAAAARRHFVFGRAGREILSSGQVDQPLGVLRTAVEAHLQGGAGVVAGHGNLLGVDSGLLQDLQQAGELLLRAEVQHEVLHAAVQQLLDRPQHREDQQDDQAGEDRLDVEGGPYGNADRGGHPQAGGGGEAVDGAAGLDDRAGAEKADAGDDLRRDAARIPGGASLGIAHSHLD